MRFFTLLFAVCALLFASPVKAEQTALGMVTGIPTGTYYTFGEEMQQLAAKQGLAIDVKASNGSVENIQRISSNENAAFGIVQSDVLGFLRRSEKSELRNVAENLRMIFPFYREEVHVLAHKTIPDFTSLSGKRIAIGNEGSGSWLTAMNLFALTGIEPAKILRMRPAEAVVAVLDGEADAMLFVGGKPVKLFKNIDELKMAHRNNAYAAQVRNLHFLALTDPRLLEEYEPSRIAQSDYGFVEDTVPTIAVRAMLVSYDFSGVENAYSKQRCDGLKQLGSIIRRHIDTLKQQGHPKWQEVHLETEVGKWQRDICSAATTASAKLEDELLKAVHTSR